MGIDYGADRGRGIALAEARRAPERAKESATCVQSQVRDADVSRETSAAHRIERFGSRDFILAAGFTKSMDG